MPRLRNKRALANCRAKVKYPTRERAQAAAYALRRAKGVNARAYRCNGGRFEQAHWHVTSGRW